MVKVENISFFSVNYQVGPLYRVPNTTVQNNRTKALKSPLQRVPKGMAYCRLCTRLNRVRLMTFSILLVLMFLLQLDEVDARRRRGKRNNRKNRFRNFRNIVLTILIFLVAPVIISFLLALWRDPAVPQLLRVTTEYVKERFTSFLGQKSKDAVTEDQSSSERVINSRGRRRRPKSG